MGHATYQLLNYLIAIIHGASRRPLTLNTPSVADFFLR
jgi:hypothetical protein